MGEQFLQFWKKLDRDRMTNLDKDPFKAAEQVVQQWKRRIFCDEDVE